VARRSFARGFRGRVNTAAHFLGLLAMALAPPCGLALPEGAEGIGLHREVVFTQYSPLSAGSELMRRLLSPLAQQFIQTELREKTASIQEQSINLATERFVVYIPARMPADGYALLVFVAPWQEARVPPGWESILDSLGVIFVSAARSGNDESPMGRREPLALLAMHNISQQYHVDPRRVYIGGFSGGARVALRLALGYPDIFTGALLNAGSDSLGIDGAPLPPRDLFLEFQNSTRIVYLTGDKDSLHLAMDMTSEKSMRQWCVHDFDGRITPFVGHSIADSGAMAAAFRSLSSHAPSAVEAVEVCRATVEKNLSISLQRAKTLIASGKRSQSRRLLMSIDAEFGSLAMPQLVDLAAQCDCHVVSPKPVMAPDH
jgi:hypothetical protein